MKRLSSFVFALAFSQMATAEVFVEKFPVYGVVKPAAITTLLAVNHGMVNSIKWDIGDKVRLGTPIMSAIEKETLRTYRTSLSGKVAKIHVTVGAALTPGMPLVTIINPAKKKLEISLSPAEAEKVRVGSVVYQRGQSDVFGKVSKISPLVDPDSGGVVSYVKTDSKLSHRVGDVVALDLQGREIEDCKVVQVSELDEYLVSYKLEATSGSKACLRKK
jgi:hypothetical protein